MVDVDPVFDRKVDALTALVPQTFEGGVLGSQERMDAAPPASQPKLRAQWLRENGSNASQVRQSVFVMV